MGQDAPFFPSPAKRKRAARTACFLASVWHIRWCTHGVRSAGTGRKACGDSGLGKFAQAVIELCSRLLSRLPPVPPGSPRPGSPHGFPLAARELLGGRTGAPGVGYPQIIGAEMVYNPLLQRSLDLGGGSWQRQTAMPVSTTRSAGCSIHLGRRRRQPRRSTTPQMETRTR